MGNYRGHRVVYHQGEINGFITFLARFLDDATAVILLSNANGKDIDPSSCASSERSSLLLL